MKLKNTLLLIFLIFASNLVFSQYKKSEIANQINTLPINTDKATYEKLLNEFVKEGGDILDIEDGYLKPLNEGYDVILPLIEKIVLPTQNKPSSLTDYYRYSGVAIGAFCNNQMKAIDYLKKAIEIAESNGLNKKLFNSAGGHLNHAWGNIAVNYERLGDYKNSAISYLKAAKEIKKFYPINTKEFNDFLGISSYMMYKYLSESYKGNDTYGEYFPFFMDYAEVGNLKGLSALWNYFIDKHDISGLNMIDFDIIPNEKDNNSIGEYYWAVAEQFQHDEFYEDAVFYHIKLIMHSQINNLKQYLYDDYNGIKHSRFEKIGYCFEQDGQDENYVQSILNALSEVSKDFGQESKEFEYYSNFLEYLMDNSKYGPILEKILKEIGYLE